MRNRAGVILEDKKTNKILLINRIKSGDEYWVIPGGGVEDNEDYFQAARREVAEELGMVLEEITELCEIRINRIVEKYYLSYVEENIEISIKGEEYIRQSTNNVYKPMWVRIIDIIDKNILPIELKNILISYYGL